MSHSAHFFVRHSCFALFALVPAVAAPGARGDVVINEIHHNGEPNPARVEFIELHNSGPDAVDISGWFFSDGISFTFPQGSSIPADGYAVVAEDPASLQAGFGITPFGPYAGGLSGDGERVELRTAAGVTVDEVDYQAEFPWPVGADGTGGSMELIHPALDNDLGGSWRSSLQPGAQTEKTIIASEAAGWRWRRGTSEASSPVSAWRLPGFAEDGTWNEGQTFIGFGSVTGITVNTNVAPMQGQHSSVFARKTFTIAPGEIAQRIETRYTADDGLIVWINGNEVVRYNVAPGEPVASDTATGISTEGEWRSEIREDAAGLFVEGENVIAVQFFNDSLFGSDAGFDAELKQLATPADIPPRPTPGARNSVFSANAPPQIRQVDHTPKQPAASEAITITAKATDPDGIDGLILEYQIVAPGAYVPAYLAKSTSQLLADPNAPLDPNPAYFDAANWTAVPMMDDGTAGDAVAGDDVFTATLSGYPNRTVLRYRITAADAGGASVRVPYADDESLNFGCFVYNGVPAYTAATRSVNGAPHTYPADVMTSLPVYHLLTTPADFDQAVAYNGGNQIPSNNFDARSAYNWTGTFVYDGDVFDNIGYRLRQRNARYSGSGKRSFRFKFHRGNWPRFHDNDGDEYSEKWRTLASHKMVGSRGNPTWGMDQASNHRLWQMVGTPASETHWFHLRVVKGPDEAPSGTNGQYLGDFYGIELALQEFHKEFLDSHELEPGNLYKLISYRTDGKDVQRYQAPNAVTDASDFSNIIFQLRPDKSDAWLHQHVNYDQWNWYHAIVDAVRHYDVQPNTGEHLKNRAYYFEPDPGSPLGRLQVFPWDSDTSWGPNWNAGVDFCKYAVWSAPGGPRPEFLKEYRNVVREIRDLIWTEEQIDLLLDPLAETIEAIVPADRDRWTQAVGGSQSDPPLASVVADMKKFAFIGGSWVGGDDGQMEAISRDSGLSGQQGRDAYLDALGADAAIPHTPTITFSGTAGHPQDGIRFTSSAFSDPQGAGTFGGVEFRVAEISDEFGIPEMEWNAEWESGVLSPMPAEVTVPAADVRVGRTYRARVRHIDSTGRWSHWSSPAEFTVTSPAIDAYINGLVIAELMYHPAAPTADELAAIPTVTQNDFEFLELLNIGNDPLDLTNVRLTKGIDFDFAGSAVTEIAPGQRIVIVRNIDAFNLRYGHSSTPAFVAGSVDKNLSNAGENVRLSYGAGTLIREFTYDDSTPWPDIADGAGASLVLARAETNPDPTDPANWIPSGVMHGTPGFAEPTLPPADPLSDDDGDSVPAIIEFAVGSDPDSPGGIPPIFFISGSGPLLIDVPVSPAAAESVTLTVEVSPDLVIWLPADFVRWTAPGRAAYQPPQEIAPDDTLFVRLRAETIP